MRGLARSVEAEVRQGFPGAWTWRTVQQLPERYAWTIDTVGEPDHYVFDGEAVRAFVGSRQVSVDASPTAPLRSHARFMAVVGLDALRLPGVRTTALEASALPAGATSGVEVQFDDDGSRYRLGFDTAGLLVWAAGRVALPPFGTGDLEVEFGDFRRVGSWLLPHRTQWRLGGAPLATERVRAACPDPPGLLPGSFRTPATLPVCPPS